MGKEKQQTTDPQARLALDPCSPAPASSNVRSLTDTQRIAWLQLIRSENVGPVTFRELVNHFGGAESALEALPDLARRGGRKRAIKISSRAAAETELATAKRLGAFAVAAGEPGYPSWLEHIDAPPPLIYAQGRLELARVPMVAIVGSRDGSAAGRKLARTLARDLGAAGYVIASGLARGVDGEAHSAALDTGTSAAIAGGIDVVYPPEHAALHEAIAERGLLVSERPPGLPPKAKDFPRRNRIISGMSRGVIVIEAAKRSGTLITARMAAEQGREVFAVPGHPLDPRAIGTNMLLKQGATLVTSAEDVLEALRPIDDRAAPVQPDGLSDALQIDGTPLAHDGSEPAQELELTNASDRERLASVLGPTPIEIDELCRATNLSARAVRAGLLELDLGGRLQRHQNQLVSLLPGTDA